MPRRPWLPKVRHLLGVVPDYEIARLVGVSKTTVRNTRASLGVKARIGRTLDELGPAETIRRIRERARSGKSMRQGQVASPYLMALCNRHFGGWYQAVEAAGLKPQGKPHRTTQARLIQQKRALTPALLQGPKSSAELERLTGVASNTVRHRRELLGIRRDERRRTDLSWLPSARRLLGKVPDTDIAEQIGVAPWVVTAVRKKLGIAQTPKKSMAASGEVRERLRRMSKRELRQFLAVLDPIDAKIISARYLKPRPVTLARLGANLGISRQRVAQREAKAVRILRDTLNPIGMH